MKSLKYVWFLMVALMLVATGCATPGHKFASLKSLGAPDWVDKVGGAFGGEKGKVIYGVGVASNIQNVGLLRSSADNKARNAIAQVLQTKTMSLYKGYAGSTSAGQANTSSEEQHVEEAIKNVTSQVLSGSEIVDHWQHPDTGDMYTLARLDFQTFADTLTKSKELNAKVRDYIRDNATKLQEDLDKEVGKMEGK